MANPFGLVYGGAIEANEPGKVNIRPVRYTVDGIEAAANLYLPADYSEKNKKKWPTPTAAVRSRWRACMRKGLRSLALSHWPVTPVIRGRAAESHGFGTIPPTALGT